jgi:predicted transcriptional regulator
VNESKDIYLIENDENVNILGMIQNKKPFQIPLSLELIDRSFSNLSKAAPALINIVNIKNINARVNYPEIL